MVCTMYFEGSGTSFVFCNNTGKASTRTLAKTGEVPRVQEWEPAQRIPIRGNELASFQLVQQVKHFKYQLF